MLKLKYLFENFELAKECLKQYRVDEDSVDAMLRHFRISSNAVYTFRNKKTKNMCFLRLSPSVEKPYCDVESEIHLINWLVGRGFPAMKPHPMKDGRFSAQLITKWGTYNVLCFDCVAGKSLEDVAGDLNLAYGYGEILGKLHALSKVYPYANERRNHGALMVEIQKRLIGFHAPAAVMTAYQKVEAELKRLRIDNDVYGIVHYDFEPDNVFYDAETASFGVIDFDDAIRCWYALDLARAVDAMDEVVDEKLAADAVERFFAGYRSENAFSKEQEQTIPLMRRLVHLQEYATLLYVLSEPVEEEPEWMVALKERLNRKLEMLEASM